MIEAAILCMALNIYHEARSEPVSGQQAVALVTMNRAKGSPSKVCETVFKPKQFSWTSDAKEILDPDAWAMAMKTATVTVNGKLSDFTRGATHYHAIHVRPCWRKAMTRLHLVGVGRHVFYRKDQSAVTCPGYNQRINRGEA